MMLGNYYQFLKDGNGIVGVAHAAALGNETVLSGVFQPRVGESGWGCDELRIAAY